jgi:DNA-binding transcriptional ArsR family regulator
MLYVIRDIFFAFCKIILKFIVILQYTNTAMGTTKTEFFTEKQNTTATLLKALAHPARIAIIEYLLKVNTCICGDIVNELPLSQPTVSQHLKELKSAGIIKGNIEGNTICYCLNETAISGLQEYFGNIATKLENKNNCC